MSSFVPSAITQPFFKLQTPDFAWKFVWTVPTNYEKKICKKKIFKKNLKFGGWVPTLIKPNLIKSKSHKTISHKKIPSLINFVYINL